MSEDTSEGFGAYLERCMERPPRVSLVLRSEPCGTCGEPWITLKIEGLTVVDCCLSFLPRDRDAVAWGGK